MVSPPGLPVCAGTVRLLALLACVGCFRLCELRGFAPIPARASMRLWVEPMRAVPRALPELSRPAAQLAVLTRCGLFGVRSGQTTYQTATAA